MSLQSAVPQLARHPAPRRRGSEVYVENVARSLAAASHDVTIFCAMYGVLLIRETLEGVHYVRAGTKLSVCGEAVRRLRRREFGPLDDRGCTGTASPS